MQVQQFLPVFSSVEGQRRDERRPVEGVSGQWSGTYDDGYWRPFRYEDETYSRDRRLLDRGRPLRLSDRRDDHRLVDRSRSRDERSCSPRQSQPSGDLFSACLPEEDDSGRAEGLSEEGVDSDGPSGSDQDFLDGQGEDRPGHSRDLGSQDEVLRDLLSGGSVHSGGDLLDRMRELLAEHDDRKESKEVPAQMGTAISKELFEETVRILREQLGFIEPEPVVEELPTTRKKSCLRRNEVKKDVPVLLPVDVECGDRYEAVANNIDIGLNAAARVFKTEESKEAILFNLPQVPSEATDKLKRRGRVDNRGFYVHAPDRQEESLLGKLDGYARQGLKFASSLLLLAEVMFDVYVDIEESKVSPRDVKILVSMLCPLARLIFDQFCRISVRSTISRRNTVLKNLDLPSKDVRDRFEKLPLVGVDLFGGKFEETLSTEVKKQRSDVDSDFLMRGSRRSSSVRRPFRRGEPFSSRGGRRSDGQNQRRSSSRGAFASGSSRGYARGVSMRGRPSFQPRQRFQTQQRSTSASRGIHFIEIYLPLTNIHIVTLPLPPQHFEGQTPPRLPYRRHDHISPAHPADPGLGTPWPLI